MAMRNSPPWMEPLISSTDRPTPGMPPSLARTTVSGMPSTAKSKHMAAARPCRFMLTRIRMEFGAMPSRTKAAARNRMIHAPFSAYSGPIHIPMKGPPSARIPRAMANITTWRARVVANQPCTVAARSWMPSRALKYGISGNPSTVAKPSA